MTSSGSRSPIRVALVDDYDVVLLGELMGAGFGLWDQLGDEQRAYLEGLFAGLANRGFKFSDVEANPAAAPGRPKADENLIFEERVKR